jgi:hypothetical protein
MRERRRKGVEGERVGSMRDGEVVVVLVGVEGSSEVL